MADFNQVVALPVFAPVKQSQDKGADGTYAVFSNGPYQLKAAWDPSAGGTFVRNPKWDKGSDPIRQAKPASIDYVEGTESQTAVQQVINDDEAPPSVGDARLGAARRCSSTSSPTPALKARSVNPSAQFVDYLAPNVEHRRDAQRRGPPGPRARHQPRGLRHGPRRRERRRARPPRSSARRCPGTATRTRSGPAPRATPRAARAALQESGLTLPVKITVAYRSTPTADKAHGRPGQRLGGRRLRRRAPADRQGLLRRGRPQPGRTDQTDVFWANWAPAWPSASTVIPPLFDSRINLSDERQRPRLRRLRRRRGQRGDHPDRRPCTTRPPGERRGAPSTPRWPSAGSSSPSPSAGRCTSPAAR